MGDRLLGLLMIVKDEAASLERTLSSVSAVIDKWMILDTGSTDGSPDIARRLLRHVPGEVQFGPFEDYSQAFNLGLERYGQRTAFAVRLAGDETLEGGSALRAFLHSEATRLIPCGAYDIRLKYENLSYVQPRVTSTSIDSKFQGRVHEALILPPGVRCGQVPDPVRVVHDRQGRTEASPRDRTERYLNWIKQDMAEDPTNPRYVYFYAQTLKALDENEAARAAYLQRATMPGSDNEIASSLYRAAELTTDETAPYWFIRAWERSPRRCEPLVKLSRWLRSKRLYRTALVWARQACEVPLPEGIRIAVDIDSWRWKRWSELALSGYFANEPTIGRVGLYTLKQNLISNDPEWLWNHYQQTAECYDRKFPI